jgi:hypothetical protein
MIGQDWVIADRLPSCHEPLQTLPPIYIRQSMPRISQRRLFWSDFRWVACIRCPKQVAGIVLVDSSHADQDETWYHALPVESSTEAEPVKQARSMLHNRLEDRGETGERLDMVASREQVRSIKSLGTIPLVVLTHSPKYKVDPRLPDDLLNAIESHSQRLQKQFLALSSHSKQMVAKEAGHAIHVDEPELVIAAINALRTKVD